MLTDSVDDSMLVETNLRRAGRDVDPPAISEETACAILCLRTLEYPGSRYTHLRCSRSCHNLYRQSRVGYRFIADGIWRLL